jgi:hypothetical protein
MNQAVDYLSQPAMLKAFPNTRYYPQWRLVTWHPRGVFDSDLADRVLDFMESEERVADVPFNRYADLNGLSEIRIKLGHFFRSAERRRAGYSGEPVKCAVTCESIIGFGIARLYETLMEGAAIHVRAFRTREAAVEWLGVSSEILASTNAADDPARQAVAE